MTEAGERKDRLRRQVLLDVLREHLEELDFLWEQRERVVFAPDWTIRRLGELEDRAEAHLDGLRIGGGEAIDLARPALAGTEPGAATAAAFVLLAANSATLADEVITAATSGGDEVRDGIRIALRHGDVRLVRDRLYDLAVGSDNRLRAFAADVLTFHRLRPPPPEVDRLLDDPNDAVTRLGYAAAGRLTRVVSARHLHESLERRDGLLRWSALEAAARSSLPELPALCRTARRVPEALAMLGVIGAGDDLPVLCSALAESDLAAGALAGLGSLGHVAALPHILDAMRLPPLARAAGAAFVQLTGLDDIREPRALTPPDLDTPDADAIHDEPLPDPARAGGAWERVRDRFTPSGRWQAGMDVSNVPLAAAMSRLPLRGRRDVYLRARVLDPQHTPDLELEQRVRAPGSP